MAKYGQTPINNTAAAEKARQPVEYTFAGEKRLDRRPYGKIERFVDPVGNVITVQMAAAGDPRAAEAANGKRLRLHADGWVEHTKCPFKHGHHNSVTGLAKQLKKLPANLTGECAKDPVPMAVIDGEKHAQEACPHIEWLIKHRRAEEAKQAEKRNAKRAADEKRAAEMAELQTMQLEELRERRKTRKPKESAE